MALRCDRLWRDARLATLASAAKGLGEIEDGIVACAGGRIVYAGPAAEAPALEAAEETACEGRWITPGLVDCHTHLVFAGDRSGEFERRAAGETYAQIARSGGGILATVAATRVASEEALTRAALGRLDALVAEGATTVEVKSGYGLTSDAELACLRVVAALATRREARIVPTLLALHALPPEYADRRAAYVEMACTELIPAVAREGLAQAVDAFCEGIAFSPAEVRQALEAAKREGLAIKLHAEQLSNQGGAALAAELGALSADHLEYLDEAGAAAMGRAGTVGVLLPGAFYFMRETRIPPVEMLRAARVPIALATDCNPGTSPLTSLLMTMNLAATLFRLTVTECVAGVTREGARALGLAAETGTLEAGKACDLAIWDIEQPAELVWRMGFNPLWRRVWRGLG